MCNNLEPQKSCLHVTFNWPLSQPRPVLHFMPVSLLTYATLCCVYVCCMLQLPQLVQGGCSQEGTTEGENSGFQ